MMNFKTFYKSKTNNAIMDIDRYYGILKSDYPNWNGWSVLNALKRERKSFKNEYLEILVYNFYMVSYIANKMYL